MSCQCDPNRPLDPVRDRGNEAWVAIVDEARRTGAPVPDFDVKLHRRAVCECQVKRMKEWKELLAERAKSGLGRPTFSKLLAEIGGRRPRGR